VAAVLASRPIPAWLNAGLSRLRNWSLKSAVGNVAIGERMRERVIGCGIEPTRVTVIENWGHTLSVPPAGVESSRLRSLLGLQRHFVVGYSGNLGRAHDHTTLLDAAIALRADPLLSFLVTGGGHNYNELRREVAANGLQNMVFLPYQPREALADSLAAADVHLVTLLPALEGLIVPSKVYGIMAAARPVVFIGDLDGEVSRLIRQGQCGYALNIGDVVGLVVTLRSLRADAVERLAIGRRSYAAFCRRNTAQYGIDQWHKLLGEVTKSSSSPAIRALADRQTRPGRCP